MSSPSTGAFDDPSPRYQYGDGPIEINAGRRTVKVTVRNTGDRAVQVGSDYHFFEVNSALEFDRDATLGMHLNIAAGTAVRFEPGGTHEVELCTYAGTGRLHGFSGLLNGSVRSHPARVEAVGRAMRQGFRGAGQEGPGATPAVRQARRHRASPAPGRRRRRDPTDMPTLSRKQYADLFGPTVGDRFRLADTNLVVEVEKDFREGSYGDEVVYGGGKTMRDGMASDPQATAAQGALDLVITNVVVMDPVVGVVKCDIGVKDGFIAGIGKAGNPQTQDAVDPRLVIGAGTEVIAGEHLIATAGAMDSHVHLITPSSANRP